MPKRIPPYGAEGWCGGSVDCVARARNDGGNWVIAGWRAPPSGSPRKQLRDAQIVMRCVSVV